MPISVSRIATLILIIASYSIFLLPTFSTHNLETQPGNYYSALTEGFLQGHLSLSITPSAALLALHDPYDPQQNLRLRLHDASLYNGKYYLYFGPLPALAFYAPLKFLTGYYPSPTLAIFYFLCLSLFANFYLLIKIKEKFFPTLSEWQLYFALALIGFTNHELFLLAIPRFYEVAVAATYCCMSIAILFLYKLFCENLSYRNVFFSGFFLSLCVAGRPHFALVCIGIMPIIIVYIIKQLPKSEWGKFIVTLLFPICFNAILLALYNYLRFDSIFEFGHRFQLGLFSYLDNPIFGERGITRALPQIYYYFIQPHFTSLQHFIPAWLAKQEHGRSVIEFTAGVLTTSPFILFSSMLPILFLKRTVRGYALPARLKWFLRTLLLIPSLILCILLCVYYTAERYEVDFLPYIALIAILCFWVFLSELRDIAETKWVRLFYLGTGCMSLLCGMTLALSARSWPLSIYLFSHLTIMTFLFMPVACALLYFLGRLVMSD